MNRVIEFRIWDEGYKQMYYAKNGYAPVSYFGLSNSDLVASTMANKHHLMQFTGLTDKNGKKIFEGDIIKGETRNFEVVYQAPFFTTRVGCDLLCGRYEVIGNIYENLNLCNT
jgi:uncharacterized phage protein (TIGR01671 family)